MDIDGEKEYNDMVMDIFVRFNKYIKDNDLPILSKLNNNCISEFLYENLNI